MLNQIIITPVLNGWIVTAGCQRLAFSDPQRLANAVWDWLVRPEETEKRFIAESINRRLLGQRTLEQPRDAAGQEILPPPANTSSAAATPWPAPPNPFSPDPALQGRDPGPNARI